MNAIEQLSLLVGPSFLSGINAYATVGFLGAFAKLGWIGLPKGLDGLAHPLVFGLALVLFVVEFVADKVPAFDSIWDGVQSFVRIPCGAVLAYGAIGTVEPQFKIAAVLLGGTLAASSHATKAGIRAMANLSPEPFSNWILSLAEDGFVIACLWLIFFLPVIMLGIFTLFLIFAVWFFPKMFRIFKAGLRKGAGLLRPPA